MAGHVKVGAGHVVTRLASEQVLLVRGLLTDQLLSALEHDQEVRLSIVSARELLAIVDEYLRIVSGVPLDDEVMF